jgi:hypothetical protein
MKKSLLVLAGILLLSVMVYFFLIQKERKTFAPVSLESFLTLDSAGVDSIQFSKFGTRMVFRKMGEDWYMIEPDSFRADDKAIGQLLNATSHLEVGEMISSNPEKQTFFQVDSFTGTTISFFTPSGLQASLVLGKTSKDFMHTYLRKANSDQVYLGSGLLSGITQRNVEEWKDRSIFAFDPQKIRELDFDGPDGNFKLIRSDSIWNLSRSPFKENSRAKAEAVNDYLFTLANIQGDEMAKRAEIDRLDFSQPEFELTLVLADGQTVRLLAAGTDAGAARHYVKTDAANNVFVLYDYTFKRLIRKPEDFQSS